MLSWYKNLRTVCSDGKSCNATLTTISLSHESAVLIDHKVNKSRKVPSNIRDVQPLFCDVIVLARIRHQPKMVCCVKSDIGMS